MSLPPPATILFHFIHHLISPNLLPSPWFTFVFWKYCRFHTHTCVSEDAPYYCQFFFYFSLFLNQFFLFMISLFSCCPSSSLSPFFGDPSPLTIWTPPILLSPSLSLCLPADSSLSKSRPIWGRLCSTEKDDVISFSAGRQDQRYHMTDILWFTLCRLPSRQTASVTLSCRRSVCATSAA